MDHLQELSLVVNSATGAKAENDLRPLKAIRSLTSVIRDARAAVMLREVLRSPSLEALSFTPEFPERSSLDAIRNHPALRDVRFDGELTEGHVEILASLSRLKVLVVRERRASKLFQAALLRLPNTDVFSSSPKKSDGDGASLWLKEWLPPSPKSSAPPAKGRPPTGGTVSPPQQSSSSGRSYSGSRS